MQRVGILRHKRSIGNPMILFQTKYNLGFCLKIHSRQVLDKMSAQEHTKNAQRSLHMKFMTVMYVQNPIEMNEIKKGYRRLKD